MKANIYLLLTAAILGLCEGTLSQSDKKAKKDSKKKASEHGLFSGPVSMSVYMKGLVTTKISSRWFSMLFCLPEFFIQFILILFFEEFLSNRNVIFLRSFI